MLALLALPALLALLAAGSWAAAGGTAISSQVQSFSHNALLVPHMQLAFLICLNILIATALATFSFRIDAPVQGCLKVCRSKIRWHTCAQTAAMPEEMCCGSRGEN